MRLAHITTVDLSLRFLLRDQLCAFRDAGFEIVGISAPGPWVADLERDGFQHVPVPALRRRWAPTSDLLAFAHLAAIFRRYRPAIVHTHTPKAGVLGRLAARTAGVPIIVNTVHGLYTASGSPLRRLLVMRLERLAAQCSDFEFCQSTEDLQTLRELRIVDPTRSAYIGNAVNLRTFDPDRIDRRTARAHLGLPAGAVVVGTVGRLVWEKGYREFLAMAETLRAVEPTAIAVVVGPEEPAKGDAIPPSVIDRLQRSGTVRILGMRTDMAEVYAAMDIFVLASYREGFPRSAVEAAAMGLPLVLTNIRGCREAVQDGRNGFLVPPRQVEPLLDRVRRLIRDPALRMRMGGESRRRALAEFDERRIISTTLDMYRHLLGAKFGVRSATHQDSAARG